MWKKTMVGMILMISLFCIGNVYHQANLHAESTDSKYYYVDEIFEETGKDTFLMGGNNMENHLC